MYLVEKYDPTHKLSFDKPEDKIHQLQWLFFQASGQGYVVPRPDPFQVPRYPLSLFSSLPYLIRAHNR